MINFDKIPYPYHTELFQNAFDLSGTESRFFLTVFTELNTNPSLHHKVQRQIV